MIRIGLIGAGGMAGVYADRLADVDGATVAGVASPNSAERFVTERVPTATAHSDVGELCSDADLDAVAVLTPTHRHRNAVETATDHGLDVICEKPLARTLEGAWAIRDAVETAGVRFMTAHVVRFFPEYERAKELVEDGAIGTPGVARTRRAFGFAGDRGWFDDIEHSGGVLLDLAVHDFDYLRWLLGDVEHVFTRRDAWSREGTGEVSLTLVRFESGAVAHVESWWVEVPTVPFTTALEVAGDEGLIEYDTDDVQPLRRYGTDAVTVPRDPVGSDLPLRRDGYYRQLDHFVDCVERDAQPSVTVEDGIDAMRVSLAAIESAERGVPVTPAEVGR